MEIGPRREGERIKYSQQALVLYYHSAELHNSAAVLKSAWTWRQHTQKPAWGSSRQ
jgi:hypothetical protein